MQIAIANCVTTLSEVAGNHMHKLKVVEMNSSSDNMLHPANLLDSIGVCAQICHYIYLLKLST